jgi:hypothetical protein
MVIEIGKSCGILALPILGICRVKTMVRRIVFG